MLEARGDARLVEEHLAQLFAVSEMRLDAFQRDDLDEALDPAALGDVEAAHPALAEQAEQLVAAEGFSDASRLRAPSPPYVVARSRADSLVTMGALV